MTYTTLEYAEAYFAVRLSGSQWTALPEALRQAALQSASDAIDLYVASVGSWKSPWTEPPQIPDAIQRACCEEALRLTDAAATKRRDLMRDGVRAASIGGASESYADDGTQRAGRALLWSGARELLRPYLRIAGRMVPIR